MLALEHFKEFQDKTLLSFKILIKKMLKNYLAPFKYVFRILNPQNLKNREIYAKIFILRPIPNVYSAF